MSVWTSLFLRYRSENMNLRGDARNEVLAMLSKNCENLTWSVWYPLSSLDISLSSEDWSKLSDNLIRAQMGDTYFGDIPSQLIGLTNLTELFLTRTMITQVSNTVSRGNGFRLETS